MSDLGFRIWRILHGYRDPVPGTLRVTDIDWNGNRRTLIGVVSAPGLTPTPVTHTPTGADSRYVVEGSELPIIVDRTQPSKFRIAWDQVPTWKQHKADVRRQEMDEAAALAARMAAGEDAPPGPGQFGFTSGPFTGGTLGSTLGGGIASAFSGTSTGDIADAVSAAIADAFGGHQSGTWNESHVHIEMVNGAPIAGGGVPATAVVRDATDVALPGIVGGMVPGGLVDLTLEVTPPDGGTPYTAYIRIAFSTPERRARVATPGTRLPVRVDPAVPTRLTIDAAALDLD